MNIREIATSRLREYDNNPRNNDLAVEKVKYSIERFGFLFPVVVDMNYTIVAGHTRVRACRELGIMSIPCIIADELTDEQVNLFRLVDNKTSEYSDWDFEKLKSELSTVDLTLDKNQLLLDRFELSVEAFDIEPEQAEIRIPTFNFMGEEKKAKVSTIRGKDEPVTEPAKHANEYESVDSECVVSTSKATTDNEHKESVSQDLVTTSNVSNVGDSDEVTAPASTNIATPTTPVKKDTTPTADEPTRPIGRAPALIQFRFGEVQFFISQVELDRLNTRYAEFIDSGAMNSQSFTDYLLKGVESID